jgi:hypothetical protein
MKKKLKKQTHGHYECYRVGQCRCTLCTEAMRKENKKYYNKEKHRLRTKKYRERVKRISLQAVDSSGETQLTPSEARGTSDESVK